MYVYCHYRARDSGLPKIMRTAMIRSSLWFFLIALIIRVTIQRCTIEEFESKIALDIVMHTQMSEESQNFTINRIIYNCLSTSQIIGIYRSMSVSVLYNRSDAPNRLRQVRYDMRCLNNLWLRVRQMPTAFLSNNTRTDCFDCTRAVNDHHCTC